MRLLLGKIKNIKANQIDLLKCPKRNIFSFEPQNQLLGIFSLFLCFLVFFSVLLGFLLKMKTVNYFRKAKNIQAR